MRRMLKRIAALLAGLTLLSALAACGEITGLDAPALMSPPKTTADRQAIYSLPVSYTHLDVYKRQQQKEAH